MRTQRFEETTEANRSAAASATLSNRAWARTRLYTPDAASVPTPALDALRSSALEAVGERSLGPLARLLATAACSSRSATLAQAAERIGEVGGFDRVGIYLAPTLLGLDAAPEAAFVLGASWARRGLGFRGEATLAAANATVPSAPLDRPALEHAIGARVVDCVTPNGVVALLTLDGPADAQDGFGQTAAALLAGFLERDRLERALAATRADAARSDRLAQLGRVACSSAHDFNNVLTAILGYADLLELEISESGRVELDEIRSAAARGAALVEEILGFGRGPVSEIREVDLVGIVRGLEPLLRRVAGERIALACDFDASLPPVRIDAQRLERVLMNLVANARHAVEARGGVAPTGRIGIFVERLAGGRVGGVRAGDGAVAGRGDAVDEARPMLRLGVRDDGCGMPPELARRALEPFFTTRAGDGGTGLGLADAADFARRCGGRIAVESVEGVGTEIALLLPVAP